MKEIFVISKKRLKYFDIISEVMTTFYLTPTGGWDEDLELAEEFITYPAAVAALPLLLPSKYQIEKHFVVS